ncbi:MAG: NERD domain-containing protein [Chthoniobacteraceae bacterium]
MFLSLFKGWFGEKGATFGMWAWLDARVYQRFNNVIVPTANGTTQIDHVIVSEYGIFVIETKNMSGWIFGNADQERWTQSVFGEKHQFQNPLRQNYRHTRALSEHLGIDHKHFCSVVFFIGECELKTELPDNVMTRGLATYIKGFQTRVLSPERLAMIRQKLAALKNAPAASRTEHVRQLRARFDSAATCPKCGSPLVRRTARTGKFAGREFLGCSGYPKCRYIRNL